MTPHFARSSFSLFTQFLDDFLQIVKLAGIHFHIDQISFLVEETIGWEGVNVEIILDGTLLSRWQVIVGDFVANQIIQFDEIFP